jgi:hypothetical protein
VVAHNTSGCYPKVNLNRTNYAAWKSDTTAVLLAANALDIAIREPLVPANLTNQGGQEWTKKRGTALNLLYMSTSHEISNMRDRLCSRPEPDTEAESDTD